MSTKAIREALSELSRIKGTTQVQAYQELEAIEKAARAIAVDGHGRVGDTPQYRAWADAMSTMQAIAEQAPET